MENRVIYEGKHPPWIEQDLFDKAQLSFRKDNKPLYRDNHDFDLAGLMTCDKCDCDINAKIKKSKYIYYHYTGGKDKCEQKKIYINELDLLPQFDEAVKAVIIEILKNNKHKKYAWRDSNARPTA